MKLPSFKRIIKSDFKQEDQPLVSNLASIWNYGIEVLYLALNNRLTLSENLSASIKDLNVQVDINGIPSVSLIIPSDVGINDVRIGKVDNLTVVSNTPTTAVMVVDWQPVQNGIKINKIVGLTPNQLYKLRIITQT